MPVSPHHRAGVQMPSMHTYAVKRSGSESPKAEGDTPVAKRAKSGSKGEQPAVKALPPDDVLRNIFGRIEPNEVATFRALKQTSPAMKIAFARIMPKVNAMLTSRDAVRCIEQPPAQVPRRLQDALAETQHLDLSSLELGGVTHHGPNASHESRLALGWVLAHAMHIRSLKLCTLKGDSWDSVFEAISKMTQLEVLEFKEGSDINVGKIEVVTAALRSLHHLKSIYNLSIDNWHRVAGSDDSESDSEEQVDSPATLLLTGFQQCSNLENFDLKIAWDTFSIGNLSSEEGALYAKIVRNNPKLKNIIIHKTGGCLSQRANHVTQILSDAARYGSVERFEINTTALTSNVMKALKDKQVFFTRPLRVRIQNLVPEHADMISALAVFLELSQNIHHLEVQAKDFDYDGTSSWFSIPHINPSERNLSNESKDRLCEALKQLTSLKRFSLDAEAHDGLRTLANISFLVPRHSSIQDLKLDIYDPITKQCADILLQIIQSMPHLKELDILGIIQEPEAYIKLGSMASKLQQLREITVDLIAEQGSTETINLHAQLLGSFAVLPYLETFTEIIEQNPSSIHLMREAIYRQQNIRYISEKSRKFLL